MVSFQPITSTIELYESTKVITSGTVFLSENELVPFKEISATSPGWIRVSDCSGKSTASMTKFLLFAFNFHPSILTTVESLLYISIHSPFGQLWVSAPSGSGKISLNIRSLEDTGLVPGSGCPGVDQEDGVHGLVGIESLISEVLSPKSLEYQAASLIVSVGSNRIR